MGTTNRALREVIDPAKIRASKIYPGQELRHIDALRPHPENPRDEIDPEDPKIIEMAGSIEKNGVIEPLVITPDDSILAGHRRRVASRVAAKMFNRPDLLYVPVVIRDIPADQVLEFMVAENMQRQDLNPLEEAVAYQKIKEKRNLNIADLGRHLEIPSQILSQSLAILRCEPEVQALYRENELPRGAAPLLSNIASREKQISYAGLLARRQISLEDFKKQARKNLKTAPPPSVPTAGEPPFVPDPQRLQQSKSVNKESGKKVKGGREAGTGPQLSPSRAESVEALSKTLSRRISMVSVNRVFDATCGACGMRGQEEVCRGCALPKLVLGLVGRSEEGRADDRRSED